MFGNLREAMFFARKDSFEFHLNPPPAPWYAMWLFLENIWRATDTRGVYEVHSISISLLKQFIFEGLIYRGFTHGCVCRGIKGMWIFAFPTATLKHSSACQLLESFTETEWTPVEWSVFTSILTFSLDVFYFYFIHGLFTFCETIWTVGCCLFSAQFSCETDYFYDSCDCC